MIFKTSSSFSATDLGLAACAPEPDRAAGLAAAPGQGSVVPRRGAKGPRTAPLGIAIQ